MESCLQCIRVSLGFMIPCCPVFCLDAARSALQRHSKDAAKRHSLVFTVPFRVLGTLATKRALRREECGANRNITYPLTGA
jgi:hypothetical protein